MMSYAGNVVNSIALGRKSFVCQQSWVLRPAMLLTPATGQLVTVLYRGPEIGGQGRMVR